MIGNLLIQATLFVFSINIFYFAYCYEGISETFFGLDLFSLKNTVSVKNLYPEVGLSKEYVDPYFVSTWVESYLNNYFATNLDKFLKGFGSKYEVSYEYSEFSNVLANGEIKPYYPKAFSISLNAKFGVIYSYSNKRAFRIIEGNVYG